MTQKCTGLCEGYKKESIKLKQLDVTFPGNIKYKIGQKWCSLCGLFFFSDAFTCSCYKIKLYSKLENRKFRI